MSREDQYNVTLAIDGKDYGTWDKLEGGSKDSEESKYKPGAMGPEISLGGTSTVENLTISRLYDLTRDHPGIKQLFALVGKGRCTVSKQPLDINGNILGAPLVYTGILKTVTPPDHDSESNDAALIALEITTAGTIA